MPAAAVITGYRIFGQVIKRVAEIVDFGHWAAHLYVRHPIFLEVPSGDFFCFNLSFMSHFCLNPKALCYGEPLCKE